MKTTPETTTQEEHTLDQVTRDQAETAAEEATPARTTLVTTAAEEAPTSQEAAPTSQEAATRRHPLQTTSRKPPTPHGSMLCGERAPHEKALIGRLHLLKLNALNLTCEERDESQM